MFSVVLYQPEIPPNTGNIIRLCANSGCELNLIEPLGFSLDQKQVRRAGLDYHDFIRVKTWSNWTEFDQQNAGRIISFSTRHQIRYSDFSYQPGDALLFGAETCGLPDQVRQEVSPQNRLQIPMQRQSRSLNLSNAVAIVVYEAWRQLDFKQ